MKLTTFTDYSLRVLMYLATAPEGRATIGEIAQAFGISEHHLVKVVHFLGMENLLVNTRGRGGGLRLAAAPREISVGRVVRLTEGEIAPAECFQDHNQCVITSVCRLSGVLAKANAAYYRALDEATLEDIVANRGPLTAILHGPLRLHG
jgi:Rrf2 family nitric oxide-sensitive transcriptional repressor